MNGITFEDYSVEDQIKLVKNAKYIVALHGAGLVNLNFCKEGTKILELFPHYYQCAYFYIFSNVMNFNYNLKGDKIKDNLFATVKFVAEVISVKKDKDNKIIEGNPDKIKFVTDSWKFTKNINQKSPNWYLSEIISK